MGAIVYVDIVVDAFIVDVVATVGCCYCWLLVLLAIVASIIACYFTYCWAFEDIAVVYCLNMSAPFHLTAAFANVAADVVVAVVVDAILLLQILKLLMLMLVPIM